MPDARLAEADALLRSGLPESARKALDAMLAHAGLVAVDRRAALVLRSRVQEELRDRPKAIADLRAALAIPPSDARTANTLGVLLADSGDPESAIDAFVRATEIDPGYARAWNNLGNAQRTLGLRADAEASFRRAVDLAPDYALASANLAVAQRDRGELIDAESTLRAALAAFAGKPPFRPLLVLLAGILRERSMLDESASLYLQAIKSEPEASTGEWFNLGWVLAERGEPERAREAFARGSTMRAPDLRNAIGRELVLPMIHADRKSITATRARFASGIEALGERVAELAQSRDATGIQDGIRWTNFLLAYQGEDDLALQTAYAGFVGKMLDAVAPQWRAPIAPRPSRGPRLRVGFASAFFHVGTCGRYFRSWITELDRAHFEVFVYHLYPGRDEIATEIETRADAFRAFGVGDAKPSLVAPVIRGDDLDAIVYPEVGMDVTTFALAAMRLAPRQFAGWGHPVTTGHATIDGYFTCAAMEREDAGADYAEPLHRLPGIGTSYRRPDVPEDADRERFGLPEDRVLLLCPQSLFKIHPDNDHAFGRILAANSRATIVFFAGRHPAITDQFMRRLAVHFAGHGIDVRLRTLVLPPVPHDDYMRINRVCDLMLDTQHWSGGNTSLDALACGLPIVTLPGRFMRGRQTAALLAMIGLSEFAVSDADAYVKVVNELVADAPRRVDLRRRIEAAQGRIFGDQSAAHAFGAKLRELLEAPATR